MKKDAWKQYTFWILFSEAVGLLAGLLSWKGISTFSQSAIQPVFTPPSIVFPVVWTILYALMGIGMARVQLYGTLPGKAHGGNLFLAQLVLNFLWPMVFFNGQAYGLALAFLGLLWILVYRMLLTFRKEDKLAGNLQIPYLIWLSFAAILNEQTWLLNR